MFHQLHINLAYRGLIDLERAEHNIRRFAELSRRQVDQISVQQLSVNYRGIWVRLIMDSDR